MKPNQATQKKLVAIFNEYFPEAVIGDLPGYEETVLALIDQARKEGYDEALERLADGVVSPRFEKMSYNPALEYVVNRIKQLKGDK